MAFPSASSAVPAVAVQGLRMTYGAKTALDDLSLSIERGSITALLGRNGAGKTTMLETCEGYRRPDAGTVRVLGLDPVADRAALMPRIGVMLQSGGAWSGVRAVEMLDHVARLHADPVPTGLLVDRLGLVDCGSTPYRRLSGGQQQRLSLAMALVGRPELLFVDEPTAGMDPGARRTTWELLEEVRDDGVSVLLTTHYLDEAERLADTVHILDHGRLVASGSPAALTASTGTIRLVAASPLPDGAADGLHTLLAGRAGSREIREITVAARDEVTLDIAGPLDLSDLGAVVTWCTDLGIAADQLALGRRTLEDVFLDLTRVSVAEPVRGRAGPASAAGPVEVVT